MKPCRLAVILSDPAPEFMDTADADSIHETSVMLFEDMVDSVRVLDLPGDEVRSLMRRTYDDVRGGTQEILRMLGPEGERFIEEELSHRFVWSHNETPIGRSHVLFVFPEACCSELN